VASHANSPRLVIVLAVLLGLAAGVIGALLLSRDGGAAPSQSVASDAESTAGDPEALADLPPLRDPIGVEEATDPETALAGFLTAEATGEWEESFAFLTPEQQEVAFRSAAEWVAAHADFPDVTGYRIDDVRVDDQAGTASVTTLTGFDPVLDPVIGLVAARGRTTWRLEQVEDGTWRVDPSATQNQPLYPDASSAAEVVRRWVDGRMACEDTSDLEQGLIGSPVLAQGLCDEPQDEPVAIGEIGRLSDSARTTSLLSDFGPEVYGWARTARVDAATPFQVVLAPLGEDWRVVGIIPAG
jgi:hypothetical protein